MRSLFLCVLFLIPSVSFAEQFYFEYEAEANAACEQRKLSGFWVDVNYRTRCVEFPQALVTHFQYEQGRNSNFWISESSFNYNQLGGTVEPPLPDCAGLICSDVTQQCLNSEGQEQSVQPCIVDVSTWAEPGCLTAAEGTNIGKTLCIENLETGEGTINGIDFIANDETMTCIDFVDQTGVTRNICAGGEKNCGMINGQFVCVNEGTGSNGLGPNSNPAPVGCITNASGKLLCLSGSENVKSGTTKSTVDNGDGTTTTTTTTMSNIVNHGDVVTTEVTNTTTGDTSISVAGTTINEQADAAAQGSSDSLEQLLNAQGFTGSGAVDNYTVEGLTFDTVLTDFNSRIQNSNISTASTNLFTVSLPASSCPTWTIPAFSQGFMTLPAFTIDQQCSSVMTQVWPIISAVVVAVATFYAIRIAFM